MNYFSLQGKVHLAERLANGRPGSLSWMGDVPDLTLKFSVDKDEVQESWSGNRSTASSMRKALKGSFDLSCRYATGKNLALGLGGSVIDVPAGTVTSEKFPVAVAGDTFMLEHRDVSEVLVTDSGAPQPKSLVLGKDYNVDSPAGGLVQIKLIDTFTQPFVGNYAYGASTNVVAFNVPSVEKYCVFDGVNTLDNSRLRAQIYRMQFDPVSDLGLIQDSHGMLKFSGSILLDVLNASHDYYGGYMLMEQAAAT